VTVDRRVERGLSTREVLLRSARECFGEHGFAATTIDDVAERAGVTKGALYHHFSDKEHLFRAVYEQLEREVSDRAVVHFLEADHWSALVSGCLLWVELHADPWVRQIVLVDARGVLGWEAARDIESRLSTTALRGALRKAMHGGVIERRPLRPLSFMLIGALSEACLYLGEASDKAEARAEVEALVTALLSGFRTDRGATATG